MSKWALWHEGLQEWVINNGGQVLVFSSEDDARLVAEYLGIVAEPKTYEGEGFQYPQRLMGMIRNELSNSS